MATTLDPGVLIGGKYRVVRTLGAGGMGTVYEAENELTLKRFAVKWLHPALAYSAEAVQRMLREAQASARVRHPNVVDVYDVGRDGDSVFLVMEYLEGETLTQAMQRGLRVPELIRLLLPAMRGVAAAHALGIVHRDIKPDNIFLARVPSQTEPLPKVLDFGISKVPAENGEQMSLTATGTTLGTPLYMSYEQLNGARHVDARTDVYAFGVILYEGLTGRTPYSAESLGALAIQVATKSPLPPSQNRPELPAELDAIVLRAIARDRDARYPSLDALIEALAPFAEESSDLAHARTIPSLAPPPIADMAARSTDRGAIAAARGSSRRGMLAGMALGAVALVAGAYWFLGSRAAPEASAPPAQESPAALSVPVAPIAVPPAAPRPRPDATAVLAAPPAGAPAATPLEPATTTPADTRRNRTPRAHAHESTRKSSKSETASESPTTSASASGTQAPAPEKQETPNAFRAGRPRLEEF